MTTRARTPNVVVPLQSLFEVMTDGILITDDAGYRTYSNRALNQLVGADARAPIGSTEPPSWLPPSQHDRYRKYLRLAVTGRLGDDVVSLDWTVLDSDSHELPAVLRLMPVRNGGNAPAAALWLIVPTPEAKAASRPNERQRRYEEAIRRIAKEVGRLGYGIDAAPNDAVVVPDVPELGELSRRERQVLDHLLQGHRVVSISDQLCVSEHTVRNHLKSIFRKLEVHSQAELVALVRSGSRGS